METAHFGLSSMETVVRGATQYPIWRCQSMARPEGLQDDSRRGSPEVMSESSRPSLQGNGHNARRHGYEAVQRDPFPEAIPPASTAADRALAAVAEVAVTVMPPNAQMSSNSVAQVHFDQSALKLAIAVKNLADGIHTIERRQSDTDGHVASLGEHVRTLEARVFNLKSETMAVVTTAKKAIHTSKQKNDYLEFNECIGIDPRSRVGSLPGSVASRLQELEARMEHQFREVVNEEDEVHNLLDEAAAVRATLMSRVQQLEAKVTALLQGQEDEAAHRLEQIVTRDSKGQEDEAAHRLEQIVTRDSSTSWLKSNAQYIQTNCDLLKELQHTVNGLQIRDRQNSHGDDVHQLWHHMKENYYGKEQIHSMLRSIQDSVALPHAAPDPVETVATGAIRTSDQAEDEVRKVWQHMKDNYYTKEQMQPFIDREGVGASTRDTLDLAKSQELSCQDLSRISEQTLDVVMSRVTPAVSRMFEQTLDEVDKLGQHVQKNFYSKVQLEPILDHLQQLRVAPRGDSMAFAHPDQGGQLRGLEDRMERNEARLDKCFRDTSDRLDPLQEYLEQQRVSTWKTGRQLPEVVQKLDQLWNQCNYYFSKVKEHDVHFSFFRSSFETHKQHCLDLGDSSSPVRPLEEIPVASGSMAKRDEDVQACGEEPRVSNMAVTQSPLRGR